MPGLIDSHVHTDMKGLRDALLFVLPQNLKWMVAGRQNNERNSRT